MYSRDVNGPNEPTEAQLSKYGDIREFEREDGRRGYNNVGDIHYVEKNGTRGFSFEDPSIRDVQRTPALIHVGASIIMRYSMLKSMNRRSKLDDITYVPPEPPAADETIELVYQGRKKGFPDMRISVDSNTSDRSFATGLIVVTVVDVSGPVV